MVNFQRKIRIIFWALLVFVVSGLLYLAVVPSGKIKYTKDFDKQNYFIKNMTPTDRIKQGQKGQKIIGDPVYFSLRTPRNFNQAKLELRFKNTSRRPVIEAGILADAKLWRYDLQPINNQIINDLAAEWHKIKEDDLLFLQREKKYESIDDFIKNSPDYAEVALYNYDLKNDYIIPDYAAADNETEINTAIRGAFEIYTYIKNEDLNFDFSIVDLNKNRDSDSFDINLYFQGQLIESKHYDDDGRVDDGGVKSEIKNINYELAGLPEGVYKLEFKAGDDLLVRQLRTKQQKVSFINKIWIDESARQEIYTDSSEIKAQIINPENLQVLKIGNSNLNIDQTYKQFNFFTDQEVSPVQLERGGIILAGDGVFSFDEKSLFNPQISQVNENLNLGKINYILADYQLPQQDGDWLVATADFDLSNSYREFYKYNVLISIPGMRADDEIDDYIEVDRISVELKGTSLWSKLKKILGK